MLTFQQIELYKPNFSPLRQRLEASALSLGGNTKRIITGNIRSRRSATSFRQTDETEATQYMGMPLRSFAATAKAQPTWIEQLEQKIAITYGTNEIQSIQNLSGTRQEVKKAYFLYGASFDSLGCIYIKSASLEELAVANIQHEIGTPTPSVLQGSTTDLTLLEPYGGAAFRNAGIPFAEAVQYLKPERFVEKALTVLQIISEMNKRSNNNRLVLQVHDTHHIDLRHICGSSLLEERLKPFLHENSQSNFPAFSNAHNTLTERNDGGKYFSWGDAQPYNILVRSNTESIASFAPQDISLTDWELSYEDTNSPADIAMWGISPTYLVAQEHRLVAAQQIVPHLQREFKTVYSKEDADKRFAADYLTACLLKVGDQLMIMQTKHDANKDDRISRAQWFLTLYYETARTLDSNLQDLSRNHQQETGKLFANIDFLAPIIRKYS